MSNQIPISNVKKQNISQAGFWRIFLLCAITASQIVLVGFEWQTTLAEQDMMAVLSQSFISARRNSGVLAALEKKKHDSGIVKGVYLTAYSAGSDKKINDIISLLDKTELNAVVLDIKDYSGLILYDSQIPNVVSGGLKDNRLGDVTALVKKLHDHNIYAIARQTVFQDPVLAEKKPEWAVKSAVGGLWRDKKGLAWVDASRKEVWDYNLAIAKEAVRFGFDEINFDYVRFPSDGNISEARFALDGRAKYEVMRDFFKYLHISLAAEPVKISVDLFGLTMETSGENDMNIGQRLADAVDQMDFVSPMMYPSHYPAGHLGLSNPADNPAIVIEHGLIKGMPMFEGKRAKLRPWIQAFDLGAVYGGDKIRAQIDTIEKYSSSTGWLLWNASNRYTAAGLK